MTCNNHDLNAPYASLLTCMTHVPHCVSNASRINCNISSNPIFDRYLDILVISESYTSHKSQWVMVRHTTYMSPVEPISFNATAHRPVCCAVGKKLQGSKSHGGSYITCDKTTCIFLRTMWGAKLRLSQLGIQSAWQRPLIKTRGIWPYRPASTIKRAMV